MFVNFKHFEARITSLQSTLLVKEDLEKRYVKEIKQLKNEINQLNDEKLSLQVLSNELRINLSSLIDQANNKNVSCVDLVCKIDLLQYL